MIPRIIGIAGGSASGKSTLARLIAEQLPDQQVLVLAIDRFYRGPPVDSWDAPEAIDQELFFHVLIELAAGRSVETPVYDYGTHSRVGYETLSGDCDLLVVEGLFTMHWNEVESRLALSIFVDCPADIRLARRLERDITERRRDYRNVLEQYLTSVRPMHDRYVTPQRERADYVVHGERMEADLQRVLWKILALD